MTPTHGIWHLQRAAWIVGGGWGELVRIEGTRAFCAATLGVWLNSKAAGWAGGLEVRELETNSSRTP